ncbi:MAG: hypothetical protein NTZ31_06770 [Actinobacteria bacterium]|nr:hypothetical protein [Actinomycetota bacterium]
MLTPLSPTAVEFTHLGKINRQKIPADGVYAVWLSVGIDHWPTLISIGTKSTFAGARGRQVEVYALDQPLLDLYSKRAMLEFDCHLRVSLKFYGLQLLLD